jgi:hypothetical protein
MGIALIVTDERNLLPEFSVNYTATPIQMDMVTKSCKGKKERHFSSG